MTNDSDPLDSFSYLATGDDLHPDTFPMLGNVSAGALWQFVPIPTVATPAEHVYVPVPAAPGFARLMGQIGMWNYAWEAGVLRHDLIDEWEPELAFLRRYVDHNLTLVPMLDGVAPGAARFPGYETLYRLLPRRMLERFGLPLLRRGLWPAHLLPGEIHLLPHDFTTRLAHAFAAHVFPLLAPGGRLADFASTDSLHLLAHNLDHWVPAADAAVMTRLAAMGRVAITPEQDRKLAKLRSEMPAGVTVEPSLMGGTVWMGEQEAWEATRDVVAAADADGKLRAIIDAIRSHRVEEDFSPRWSFAREDFERQLFRKRAKVKVTFIELSDATPVHGPDAEVHENLLWEDLFAVLDARDRRIVVCLRNGFTKVGEISRELGYANHSPVSKALARIRRRAARLLGEGA